AAIRAAQQPSNQGAAQPPSLQTDDTRGKIVARVSLVVVPVTVKDSSGDLVTDLQRNEFRIFEDGIEQPITLFSVDAFPLSAAVLIDDDLKRGTAEKVQKTLEAIAGGFSPADEVSVWRFDEVPDQITDFIGNNDDLLTQLKRIDLSSSFPGFGSAAMTNGPHVNTSPLPGPPVVPSMNQGHPNNKHINDAIYAAAEQLRGRSGQRRKIILMVSDGQNAKNNTHSYSDTLKELLSGDISVYVVGVGEANLNRGITFLGNNILAKYAHATGGDIFYGGVSREELEGLYGRVTDQARNQYTLGYSGSGTDRSKPYHSIEVRVRRPGLTLLTRDGYYLSDTP
ncbi:MAG: VWA domain-containing protein, partial [Candidatus Acidiferrales bacterium]